MTDARRGEVWMVDFGVPVGRKGGYVRPAVVISSDMLNTRKCEDVKSVSTERMVHHFGTAPPAVARQIIRTLRYVLDL